MIHSQRVFRTLLAFLIATLAACSADDGIDTDAQARAEPQTSDSAGVRIVTYTLDDLDSAPAVAVDSMPVFSAQTIAELTGDGLSRIRAVLGRADGGILVADDGGTVIRAFDAGGRYTGSHGAEGMTPGDYLAIRGLGTFADSVVVYDPHPRNRRVSVLSPDLQFVRAFGFESRLTPTTEIVPLDSMRAVMLDAEPLAWAGSGQRGGEQPRDEQERAALVLLRPDGASPPRDTVMTGPGITWRIVPGATSQIGVHYAAEPFLAGNAHGFVFAHGSAFEIRRFDATGRLTQILRVLAEPRPLTHAERDSAERWQRETRPDQTRAVDTLAIADHYPLIDALQFDRAGNTWVLPDREIAGGRGWIVFGPEGELRGWFGSPALRDARGNFTGRGATLAEVGADYVLVVIADGEGRERIEKYRFGTANPPE